MSRLKEEELDLLAKLIDDMGLKLAYTFDDLTLAVLLAYRMGKESQNREISNDLDRILQINREGWKLR